MPDKQIVCVECEQTFVFNERDQEFFKTQKFSDPKRCKPCRAAKKERNKKLDAEREQQGGGPKA